MNRTNKTIRIVVYFASNIYEAISPICARHILSLLKGDRAMNHFFILFFNLPCIEFFFNRE